MRVVRCADATIASRSAWENLRCLPRRVDGIRRCPACLRSHDSLTVRITAACPGVYSSCATGGSGSSCCAVTGTCATPSSCPRPVTDSPAGRGRRESSECPSLTPECAIMRRPQGSRSSAGLAAKCCLGVGLRSDEVWGAVRSSAWSCAVMCRGMAVSVVWRWGLAAGKVCARTVVWPQALRGRTEPARAGFVCWPQRARDPSACVDVGRQSDGWQSSSVRKERRRRACQAITKDRQLDSPW
ncbi:hypothetical protein SAMN05216188_11587 [Lentzea xinjiangensis]|uniref:Uncharacterized protein n=1 Tax=Lentzea xinjiangensis TaxID=402600 RepID=A0A1H9RVI9_9PSEU|nr:hypothetical protein SAMN05216188_11587 [Lentzea xinjiangensis]